MEHMAKGGKMPMDDCKKEMAEMMKQTAQRYGPKGAEEHPPKDMPKKGGM